jgi:putative zinc finger/helix-turn-helix YgiT family protein
MTRKGHGAAHVVKGSSPEKKQLPVNQSLTVSLPAWTRKEAAELDRIRKKLGLTQKEAAMIAGGEHNAFSRYERGEVKPVAAVVNLFRLLDRHPDLLNELKKRKAA